ncbi:MAG: zinc ribbon domain-containing protein [Anaerolineales bacterium]|nr:zinc ribbon domain-containing protein [Anaerolineales bacterium]
MPRYDYRCKACDHRFEAQHGMNEDPPPCPVCHQTDLQRLITSAPTIARGILTPAGTARASSKEELQSKWAEETPKLRKKLVDKLGEDTVSRMAPSLNPKTD